MSSCKENDPEKWKAYKQRQKKYQARRDKVTMSKHQQEMHKAKERARSKVNLKKQAALVLVISVLKP